LEIRFKNRQLQQCYQEESRARRKWGNKLGRLYVLRINQLMACLTVGDLSALPQLRFHPLKGQLDGLYVVDLDGPTRLVFSFADEAKTVVRVEEVSKHYD
jgi:plasmid maintenance system killer protein